MPDGERIFNWTQVYNLKEIPEHLIVIGSGVTGAEFASAYNLLGTKVTLVSSRDRVLPGEDADAAEVLEEAFKPNGVNVRGQVPRRGRGTHGDGVRSPWATARSSRAATAWWPSAPSPTPPASAWRRPASSSPNRGHIQVDGVSRTTATNVYAAGDCTGVFALASVAAMQGRIAMAHLLGDSRQAAEAHRGLLQHLHLPGNRHRRRHRARWSPRASTRPTSSSWIWPPTPGPR